ncbi:MAG TPA: helix-turn-helix domain-containing protein [Candidatus Aphodovivens avistercoris]|nr:helix-turn-helix domain-containing protein [Candidatus Aphodovivens avistercoris]
MPTIANILSIEMQKASSYTLNKSMYYSHLFDDLMSGQMSESPEAIRYRFSVFGYNLRTYKRIVYVDLSGDYFDSSQTQALATRFHRVLENNVYVVRDRNILLLTSTDVRTDEGITSKGRMLGEMGMIHSSLHGDDSEDAATSKALGSLKGVLEIAQEVGVRVGVSSAFTNVLQAPSHLIQARHAIISGRRYDPDGYVHLFSRYRMADILTHIDDPHALYSFRYPPLMMLIAEDSEHGTHLAWTLYVHLQEPAQPTLTCKRLFIHKNTLYYRLDRIRDIMGVDVKDGWVITQVMMTFLVLMHQGKFEELVLPKEKDPAAAKDRRGRRSRKDTPAKGSASAEGDAR